MLYELSSEQVALQETLRRMLRAKRWARAAYDGGPSGANKELWGQLVDLGLIGLGVDEAHGGSSGDAVDMLVVAEELGRAVAPVPYVAHIVATIGIAGTAMSSSRVQHLAALLGGSKIGAPVLDPGPLVIDASDASILVVARPSGLEVVENPNLEAQPSVDRTRPLAKWIDDGPRYGNEASDLRRLRWMLYAAEAVGVAADALDRTSAYTRDRQQFGVPIGTFQAVKHRLADMLVAVETARSAAYAAAWAIRDGQPEAEADLAAHMAQAVATEGAISVVSAAIQLHGGIGVTWEHDLHIYLRRAKALELACGSPAQHYDAIAAALLGPPHVPTAMDHR